LTGPGSKLGSSTQLNYTLRFLSMSPALWTFAGSETWLAVIHVSHVLYPMFSTSETGRLSDARKSRSLVSCESCIYYCGWLSLGFTSPSARFVAGQGQHSQLTGSSDEREDGIVRLLGLLGIPHSSISISDSVQSVLRASPTVAQGRPSS
jgi:hypothetical protein